MDNIIDVTLPKALMMGVDYELFWTLNPKSLSPFNKAFDLKQKYDDGISWQNGYYIRMAIASAMSKEAKYPTRPLSTKDVQKVEMSSEEIKRKFMTQANLINAKFGKEDTK